MTLLRTMNTATITYSGSLRCEATHTRSGNSLVTDAPPDNHGKGEAFSPTDLLCVSLATCIITTMAINAPAKGIDFPACEATVVKHMASDPRRVARVDVVLRMDGAGLDARQRSILEHIAHTCPVARSLHPDIQQGLRFEYR